MAFTGSAVAFFGLAAAMMYYEWARAKAGTPLLSGHPAVQMYWMTYLLFIALGIVCIFGAILR